MVEFHLDDKSRYRKLETDVDSESVGQDLPLLGHQYAY
jgi:hypothetical protein